MKRKYQFIKLYTIKISNNLKRVKKMKELSQKRKLKKALENLITTEIALINFL